VSVERAALTSARNATRQRSPAAFTSSQLVGLRQIVRAASRAIRRAPASSSVIVSTLAIGIGAATAVFSVAHAWLFRALPYEAPHELVFVWATNPEVGQPRDVMSGPTFLDLQRRTTTLDRMAAFVMTDMPVRGRDGVDLVSRLQVTPELFDVLGTHPAAGRTFHSSDSRLGPDAAIMLGHAFWKTRFGGDTSIVGRARPELGLPLVIGILPQDFGLLPPADVVTLLSPEALARENRTFYYYWVIGRLKDGVPLEVAERELDGTMRALAADMPSLRGWEVDVDRVDSLAGEPVRPAVLTLLCAVALVLLIAWSNVANLMLTNSLERLRDISIHMTLGATRGRALGQLVLEGVLLASIAGVVGVAIATALIRFSRTSLPAAAALAGSAAAVPLPSPTIDFRVVVAAGALVAATAVALGLLRTVQTGAIAAPHWSAERVAVSSPGSRRRRAALLVGQTGFTTILLIVAGLLLHTVVRLVRTDPGFEKNGVVTMTIGRVHDLDAGGRARYYTEVLRRVTATPGVTSAALNDYVLLTNEDDYEGFSIEGRPPAAAGQSPREEWRRISFEYFRTMGIPIVGGRGFTEEDDMRSPSVVIVNEAMARKYWPGENPVGRRIRVHAQGYGWSEIVGITGDVREVGLDRPVKPMFFVPYHRAPRPVMGLFVRSVEAPEGVVPAVRRAVAAVDPTRPISDVSPLAQIVSNSYAVKRTLLWIAGGLSLLAALLTTIGVYTIARVVATERTREIGVRMALGAQRSAVSWLIVRQGLWPSLMGLFIGLLVAQLLSSLIASELNDVSPADPITYIAVTTLVILTSAMASFLPARRAARIDPISALRAE
jgi:predicted permease